MVPRVFPMAEKPSRYRSTMWYSLRTELLFPFLYMNRRIYLFIRIHVSAYTVIISHKRMAAELVSFQVK